MKFIKINNTLNIVFFSNNIISKTKKVKIIIKKK